MVLGLLYSMNRFSPQLLLFFLFSVSFLQAKIPWTLEEWNVRLEKADPQGRVVYNGAYNEEAGTLSHVYDVDPGATDIEVITVNVDEETKKIVSYLFMYYGTYESQQNVIRSDSPRSDERGIGFCNRIGCGRFVAFS